MVLKELLATGSASPLTGMAIPTCFSPKTSHCTLRGVRLLRHHWYWDQQQFESQVVPEAARKSRGVQRLHGVGHQKGFSVWEARLYRVL